jgi:Na+/H+ antiporter NhaC
LDAQDIELEAPDAILGGVPFTLVVRAPSLLDSALATVRFADGGTVIEAEMGPLDSLVIPGVIVTSRTQLPIRATVGDASAELSRRVIPGWLSLMPPLIAIALALAFHEVVTSLFVGIWLGCFFLAGYNPFAAVFMTVERYAAPALGDPDHVAIVIFSLLLGGMVGLIGRTGGTRAIVQAVTPLATTPRRVQFATWLAGLAIFFDDYANTLIVGNTMRPLTDKLRVSREKLAYIVDSTAAPVASIVFVSTWVGYQISLIGDGFAIAAEQNLTDPALPSALAAASPFDIFIRSIPYLFYPILAIFTVALLALARRDFGPMLAAERRAASGGGVHRPDAQLAADMDKEIGDVPEGVPIRWWNGVVPVLTVVVTVVAGLVYSGLQSTAPSELAALGVLQKSRVILGNADPFATLLWGSLLGCVAGVLLAVTQRILSLRQAIEAWVSGIRSMTLAIVILVLAWSLGGITESLSTASYLAGVLSDRLPLQMLPLAVFLVSAVVAFATGTSWATMAILIPLIVPLSVALGAGLDGGAATGALLGGIASVLAGAIFGDHCSPISDTTVLSSMASGCDHVDHVRTQLPYAMLVAAVAAVGLLVLGVVFGASPWAALLMIVAGAAAIFAFVRLVGKPAGSSPASAG